MPQVDGAFVVLSDRYANQVILRRSSTDIDGDQVAGFGLPAGLGQVLVSEVHVRVTAIATAATTPHLIGVSAVIRDPGAQVAIDFIDVKNWWTTSTAAGATVVEVHLIPDTPVLWRDGEELAIRFGEIDTNATPTADETVLVRALRMVSGTPQQPQEFALTS